MLYLSTTSKLGRLSKLTVNLSIDGGGIDFDGHEFKNAEEELGEAEEIPSGAIGKFEAPLF